MQYILATVAAMYTHVWIFIFPYFITGIRTSVFITDFRMKYGKSVLLGSSVAPSVPAPVRVALGYWNGDRRRPMHHVWHGKDLNFLMSTYMHCVLYLELEFQHMYGSTPLPGCPADVGRGVPLQLLFQLNQQVLQAAVLDGCLALLGE